MRKSRNPKLNFDLENSLNSLIYFIKMLFKLFAGKGYKIMILAS
jgi:hypothetical protein